ncbi:hypothetical protein BT69DRAFT_1283642 [Atractiella rhizophila]|nr:hypothetical protein BT69DRAFT_1283642 [Atractiella rhizophila]
MTVTKPSQCNLIQNMRIESKLFAFSMKSGSDTRAKTAHESIDNFLRASDPASNCDLTLLLKYQPPSTRLTVVYERGMPLKRRGWRDFKWIWKEIDILTTYFEPPQLSTSRLAEPLRIGSEDQVALYANGLTEDEQLNMYPPLRSITRLELEFRDARGPIEIESCKLMSRWVSQDVQIGTCTQKGARNVIIQIDCSISYPVQSEFGNWTVYKFVEVGRHSGG